MPLDPYFTSEAKLTHRHRYRREVASIHEAPETESVEKQIGRSDYLLGEKHCPFCLTGNDAREWQAGFDSEKSKDRPPVDGKNEKRLAQLERLRR